jgi:hypothetical protein
METISLKNTENQRSFIATLYHDEACAKSKICTCKISVGIGPKGKRKSMKHPASFSVLPGSINAKVPVSALHLGQVKEALRSGWLKKVNAPPVKGKIKKVVSD